MDDTGQELEDPLLHNPSQSSEQTLDSEQSEELARIRKRFENAYANCSSQIIDSKQETNKTNILERLLEDEDFQYEFSFIDFF
jgi:hypothetical protein